MDIRGVDTGDLARRAGGLPGARPRPRITSSSEYFVAHGRQVGRRARPARAGPGRDRALPGQGGKRRRLLPAGVPVPGFAACRHPRRDATPRRPDRPPGRGQAGSPGSGSAGGARLADAGRGRRRWARDGRWPPDCQTRCWWSGDRTGRSTRSRCSTARSSASPPSISGARPYFVETGHDFPAAPWPPPRRAIAAVARAAVRAVGLGTGPAHVELRMADGRTP